MADDKPVVYATIEQLRKLWPDMPPGADDHADTMLLYASALMRAECPTLMTVEAQIRELVCCEIVKSAMKMPEADPNLASMNLTAGPFSQQLSFRADADDLYLTKKHKRLLGCGRQRAFSVDLLRGRDVP